MEKEIWVTVNIYDIHCNGNQYRNWKNDGDHLIEYDRTVRISCQLQLHGGYYVYKYKLQTWVRDRTSVF